MGSVLKKTNTSTENTKEEEEEDHAPEQDSKSNREFYSVGKLPHRLLLWLSPLNQDDPNAPDPSNVGFRRPELIPLCEIFCEPVAVQQESKEVVELDDDDDDD